MAGSATIYFAFVSDNGVVRKLGSPDPPSVQLNGRVTWWLINETGEDIDVVIKNFTNDAGEDINEYLKPIPPYEISVPGAPNHHESTYTAKVIKHIAGKKVSFHYEVWVDGKKTDPELIVDGGKGNDPKGKKAKGGKAKRGSKAGKKN